MSVRTLTAASAIASGVSGPAAAAAGITVTPPGGQAHVACYGDGTLAPGNLTTARPGRPVKVGASRKPSPPPGHDALVVNYGDGTLISVDLATGALARAIRIGRNRQAIAITRDCDRT